MANGFLGMFQPKPGGIFSEPNEALVALGSGIMSGDPAKGFAAAAPLLAARRTKNATREWLMRQGLSDDDADAAIGNPAVLSHLLKKAGKGDDVNYSLTPIYGTDAQGNTVLGTVGNDGSFKAIDTDGFNVAAGIDKVDVGTEWLLYDKRTGQMVGREPKDLAGAEAQKEIGTAQGKAAAAAAGDYQSGANALDLIDSLRGDPNRERGTGFSSVFNAIPGTAGYDFQTKVDQAKSGAFLSAIQQLRGMGALSNAEGATATAAVTRMNTATSENEFLSALDDYEKIVKQGMAKAQRTGGNAGIEMPDSYGQWQDLGNGVRMRQLPGRAGP